MREIIETNRGHFNEDDIRRVVANDPIFTLDEEDKLQKLRISNDFWEYDVYYKVNLLGCFVLY